MSGLAAELGGGQFQVVSAFSSFHLFDFSIISIIPLIAELQVSTVQEERTRLWAARHNAYWANLALVPGCR